ncbi:hypothetical protein P9112_006532 [Eukaryota sp. TZLM1-RC]
MCHEASLLLQSFLLNFPLPSRALVEQDVWCLFMTAITTGSFPQPSTSKGQRQLLHILYSGFFPECPQDRSPVSTWENSLVPYRNSFNIFLNDWLQSQRYNCTNRKGLFLYLASRARQLASNIKTSQLKICQSWTKNFIRAHCRAMDKANVFYNYLLSLIPDEPLAPLEANAITEGKQPDEVVIHSILEPYINFHFNNTRNRFFLSNACSFILNLFNRFPATATLLSSSDRIPFLLRKIGELFFFNLKISQHLLTFFSHLHCWKKFEIIP